MTAGLFSAIAVVVSLAVALYLHRQGQARRLRRAAYLDDVAALFSETLWAVAPTGFPRLSGRHDGRLYDLQVVPDTLTYRKLPALWLLVSLPEPIPLRATLDIMLRPMGSETFSHFSDLPVQIDIPPGFPPDCAIRCDDPDLIPSVELVAQHLAGLDPAGLNGTGLKELLISPNGLRIVWLAEEANRSRYLIFRDAEMGAEPLHPAPLLPLLAALGRLHDALSAAKE